MTVKRYALLAGASLVLVGCTLGALEHSAGLVSLADGVVSLGDRVFSDTSDPTIGEFMSCVQLLTDQGYRLLRSEN